MLQKLSLEEFVELSLEAFYGLFPWGSPLMTWDYVMPGKEEGFLEEIPMGRQMTFQL